jgi:hypothetical protein
MEKGLPVKLRISYGVFCQIIELLMMEELKQRKYQAGDNDNERNGVYSLPEVNLLFFDVPPVTNVGRF